MQKHWLFYLFICLLREKHGHGKKTRLHMLAHHVFYVKKFLLWPFSTFIFSWLHRTSLELTDRIMIWDHKSSHEQNCFLSSFVFNWITSCIKFMLLLEYLSESVWIRVQRGYLPLFFQYLWAYLPLCLHHLLSVFFESLCFRLRWKNKKRRLGEHWRSDIIKQLKSKTCLNFKHWNSVSK